MNSSQLQPVQVDTVAGGQRLLKFLSDTTATVGACLRFVLFSLLFVEKVLKKTIYEMFLSKVLHSSEKEDYHP